MTNDSGFAPNPFKGFLTLANCMAGIRKTKKIGDWVAGFTSVKLCKDPVGEERLIYLMKITDKVRFSDYWGNPKYECKVPKKDSCIHEDKFGDNIYKTKIKNAINPSDFIQIDETKFHHDKETQIKDLNGEYVLISDHFYYFGSSPIKINKKIRPNLPKNHTNYGSKTNNPRSEEFIFFVEDYVKDKPSKARGIYSYPHGWKTVEKNTDIKNNNAKNSKKGCSSCK
jgi:hypothetical protein